MGLLDDIKGAADDLFGGSGSNVLGIAKRGASAISNLANNDQLPNRNDVITQVLNQQLETLKRRKGGLGGVTPMQEPENDQLTSTALFGL